MSTLPSDLNISVHQLILQLRGARNNSASMNTSWEFECCFTYDMFANDFNKTHQQITHGQMLGLSTVIVSGGEQLT